MRATRALSASVSSMYPERHALLEAMVNVTWSAISGSMPEAYATDQIIKRLILMDLSQMASACS